jgi:hypothetical protein
MSSSEFGMNEPFSRAVGENEDLRGGKPPPHPHHKYVFITSRNAHTELLGDGSRLRQP